MTFCNPSKVSFTVTVSVFQMLLCLSTAQSNPILEYLFNETGTDAIATGTVDVDLPMFQYNLGLWDSADNHSADGTGVSGLPGDRAYSDPSKFLSNGHYFGGYAGDEDQLIEEIELMTTLTVQGWFKASVGQDLGHYSSLAGNVGTAANDGGWGVITKSSTDPNALIFRVGEASSNFNHIEILSDTVFAPTGDWLFFAVSYDTSTGSVEFYRGTTSTSVTAAGSGNTGALVEGSITNSNRGFYIGNNNNEALEWFRGRAFNGDLDNIRVFDTVLGMSELETLRQNDLLPPCTPFTADFDGDCDVDHDDLTDPILGWEVRYGVDLDGSNFLEWQQQLGSGVGPLGSAVAAVPEPSTTAFLFGLLSVFLFGRVHSRPGCFV